MAEALAECRRTLSALETLRTAAKSSYKHWSTHTQAQLLLARGDISLITAKSLWAESKAYGPSDAAAFSSAWSAYSAVRTGCSSLNSASATGSGASTVAACRSRASALVHVATAGKEVNDDWAAHVTMMAAKDHTDPSIYSRRWLEMVEDAQGPLARFAAAEKVAASAPRC